MISCTFCLYCKRYFLFVQSQRYIWTMNFLSDDIYCNRYSLYSIYRFFYIKRHFEWNHLCQTPESNISSYVTECCSSYKFANEYRMEYNVSESTEATWSAKINCLNTSSDKVSILQVFGSLIVFVLAGYFD